MSQNEKIIKDFGSKQKTYFEENYLKESKRNFLRRLRREENTHMAHEHTGPKRVLDVGCGPAILYEFLLEDCEQYVAVDLVQTNLDQINSQSYGEKVKCVCANIDDLQLGDEKFDVIICSGSLEYCDAPIQNIEYLSEHLSPNGRLIASFPQRSSPYRIWGKYIYNPVRQILKGKSARFASGYRRHLFSSRKVQSIFLRENGSVRFEYLGYKLLLQPLDNILASLDYHIQKELQKISSRLMAWTCTEFILVYDSKA